MEKYIYFFHSLNSPNENYSKNSFNGFDLIFSPNQVISEQLSYLVNLKTTEIVTTGYQEGLSMLQKIYLTILLLIRIYDRVLGLHYRMIMRSPTIRM